MQTLDKMKTTQYGEMIFSEGDIIDLVMQDVDAKVFTRMLVDDSVDIERAATILNTAPNFVAHNQNVKNYMDQTEFDRFCQRDWHMPKEYQQLDIAQHILDLCATDAELQRCGDELLMFQERGLFELLKYLKYLVDTMRSNNLIWGVGRGSSVASYVLYKLGVHRIDSMYYDLDPHEFLR